MATYTLLDLVQIVLSSLNSDEVNSIGDTVESMQIANIIKTTYFNVITRAGLPDQNTLFQLNPSDDFSAPVLMYKPDNVSKLVWIKYFNTNVLGDQFTDQYGSYHHDLNTDIVHQTWTTTSVTSNSIGTGNKTFIVASNTLPIFAGQSVNCQSGPNSMQGTVVSYINNTLVVNVTAIGGAGTYSAWVINSTQGIGTIPGYQYVTQLPIRQFLDMTDSYNPTDNDVSSFEFNLGGENFLFYYKNSHTPSYATVIANDYIIFDSYDNTQDSTLQASKTMCYGQLYPEWIMQDSFVPLMDSKQFPLLINEAKITAYYELKTQLNARAEQEAKRAWINVSKTKSLNNRPTYMQQFDNFGRRAGTGGYSGTRAYPGSGWQGGWLAGS
jgi:hypothetical protein